MRQYLELLQDIIDNGYEHEDRTGIGRISIIGRQLRFDLSKGFPLVTTRKIYSKALIEEMLWFIRGSVNVRELQEKNVRIWDHWTLEKHHIESFKEKHMGFTKVFEARGNETICDILGDIGKAQEGTIGPMYGYIWRNSSTGIDQLTQLIDNLKNRPYSSRHVVSAWMPELIPDETLTPQENIIMGKGALAPCHMMFQCFVTKSKDSEKPKLSLLMYQRSTDCPIGMPYNIAQYSLLTHLLAHECNYDVGEFIWSGGDVHIYKSQLELVKEQLKREPQPLPKLVLNPNIKSIFDFTAEDISIIDYNPLEKIDYPVAI